MSGNRQAHWKVMWWVFAFGWIIAAVGTALNLGLEPYTVEEWQRILVVYGAGLLIFKPRNLDPWAAA